MDAVYNYLQSHGQALVEALETALPRKSDATGELRRTIFFKINRFGVSYRFQLHLQDYYEWVDKGRRPGKQPPIASILKWIKDKGFVMHPKYGLQSQTSDRRLKQISDNLQLSTHLAWAIARKIAKKGTKGTNFYSATVPEWIEQLKIELPKAFGRDMLVMVKNELQQANLSGKR